ncbi:hypothetical protein GG344DRAFT_64765 [Lentinula edodes]|nr:hypothetical protein GG344DRAFT_64765 [Lentinula edodes]
METGNAIAEVPESEASDVSLNSRPSSRAPSVASSVAPSIALSVTSADALPPALRPAPPFVFSKDSAFEKLKSKLLNIDARPPSLDKKKIILRALCQDLNILYNLDDTNKTLAGRLMVYRQENGAKDDEDSLQIRYNQFKRTFEEDEPSKSIMMSQLLKHLEKLCREYRIPPFDSNISGGSLKKETLARWLILWIANLQLLLNNYPEIREEIGEALTMLTDIEREDHRGIFAGTDLSAWSSTEFNESPTCIERATLDRIVQQLCRVYGVQASHWDGKVARQAHILGGVALGRVIYSTGYCQNSIIFRDEGKILAGTIDKIIKHSHPHPVTQDVIAATYVEAIVMEPISEEDDLYRSLNCGWLCLQMPATRRLSTVPLSNVISHFVRTDLTLLVKENPVTHVYPVPKKVRVISADTLRLRLLEEKALLKHKEVVQLRGTAQRLRSRYEAEVDTDHLKCEFHDATASVHRLRMEILVSLGCNTVDDQCVKAITTNEAKYFWSFVDDVKSTSERLKNVPVRSLP